VQLDSQDVLQMLLGPYLVSNGWVQVDDVLLCPNHKQPAMLPSLLVADIACQQLTATSCQDQAR